MADIYDAFSRARAEYGYLFPKNLVTPESVLGEMRRKGLDSWDQIRKLGRLDHSGVSRATQLVIAQLTKEF